VATLPEAVRLSANFPWGFQVAQLAVPPAAAGSGEVHVMDGGIVDNTGIDTIAHLLRGLAVLARREEVRASQVLLGVGALLNPLPGPDQPARLALAAYGLKPLPEWCGDWRNPACAGLAKRAYDVMAKLRQRGILLVEIDSGARPQPPSLLASLFPVAFEPLGALENAAYANAGLSRLQYIDALNSSLEGLADPTERGVVRIAALARGSPTQLVTYTCNHAEHVMTAWSLGPEDKAKILVQFWSEWMLNEDNLSACFSALRELKRQADVGLDEDDVAEQKQRLQEMPTLMCVDAQLRQQFYKWAQSPTDARQQTVQEVSDVPLMLQVGADYSEKLERFQKEGKSERESVRKASSKEQAPAQERRDRR
jgi:hypothetical protein